MVTLNRDTKRRNTYHEMLILSGLDSTVDVGLTDQDVPNPRQPDPGERKTFVNILLPQWLVSIVDECGRGPQRKCVGTDICALILYGMVATPWDSIPPLLPQASVDTPYSGIGRFNFTEEEMDNIKGIARAHSMQSDVMCRTALMYVMGLHESYRLGIISTEPVDKMALEELLDDIRPITACVSDQYWNDVVRITFDSYVYMRKVGHTTNLPTMNPARQVYHTNYFNTLLRNHEINTRVAHERRDATYAKRRGKPRG